MYLWRKKILITLVVAFRREGLWYTRHQQTYSPLSIHNFRCIFVQELQHNSHDTTFFLSLALKSCLVSFPRQPIRCQNTTQFFFNIWVLEVFRYSFSYTLWTFRFWCRVAFEVSYFLFDSSFKQKFRKKSKKFVSDM